MGAVGGAGGAGSGGAMGGAGAVGAGGRGCGDGATASAVESIRLKITLGHPVTAELLVEGVGIPVCCMG